jgi:solute carrier family 41
MSPILRREHEYDPRKRRAQLWQEFARQREEHDEPPIPNQDGDVDPEEDAALRKVTRHRSYGSDQGSLESVGVGEGDPGELDVAAQARPLLKRTIVHLALTLAIQSTPSLLLSLVGLVFTGQLLDHLAVWSVFRRVDELFILVPVLGNLKGNLEMCLGARLGTSVRPRSHIFRRY